MQKPAVEDELQLRRELLRSWLREAGVEVIDRSLMFLAREPQVTVSDKPV